MSPPHQANALAVVMKEGKIVLVATPEEGQSTAIRTNLSFNDGNWHFITVTKKGRSYVLFFSTI